MNDQQTWPECERCQRLQSNCVWPEVGRRSRLFSPDGCCILTRHVRTAQKNTNGRSAATPAFEHNVTTVPEALNFEHHDDASASLNLLLSASAIPSSHSSFSSSTAPPQSRDFSLSNSPDTGMAESFSPPSSMHSHISTPFTHPNWTNETDPIYNEHLGQFAGATRPSPASGPLDDHSVRATADCELLPT